jgi:small ligand-binding sensory domain FIST
MKFVSALSQSPDTERALEEVAARVRTGLRAAPDLLFVFVSGDHGARYESVPKLLGRSFPDALLLGCSAKSVIGGGSEVEDGPGVALIAAQLPGVSLRPFLLDAAPPAGDTREAIRRQVGVPPESEPCFVLLGDPFTADGEELIRHLDEAFPGSAKVGGLASGGQEPGSGVLFVGDRVQREGFVGVALTGDVALDTIVAQGCRPVGNPMFVTRCRGNLLQRVDGRPPLEVLSELYARASAEDQALFRTSLFLGIEMRADQIEYRRGDFLIRNLVGSDADTGALAVAAQLEETQVVQFHLRDARAAAEDLEIQLAAYPEQPTSVRGVLLFSCLGRGQYLFDVPDHDSGLLMRRMGEVPVAGFFCNGEIGPVQQQTFLHGYTSAFALFRPRHPTS